MPEQREKVAIVGYSIRTLEQAPIGDMSMDIWSLNELGARIPGFRCDCWFTLHKRKALRSAAIDWLARQPCPVFTVDPMPEIPTSMQYPFDEVRAYFCRDFFMSQMSWMLALAMLRGYKEIHLYGVDMAMGGEYAYQLSSMAWLIGIADGLRKATGSPRVVIPDDSLLLKGSWLYGYEDPPTDKGIITETEISESIMHLEAECKRASDKALFTSGMVRAYKDVMVKFVKVKTELMSALQLPKNVRVQLDEPNEIPVDGAPGESTDNRS